MTNSQEPPQSRVPPPSGDALSGERTDYRGADLRGAKLSGRDLAKANFDGADLTDANLEGANLEGASFVAANLARTKLRRARLVQANLTHATLNGADVRGASLEAARLRGAHLFFVKLRGADLSAADLADAQFEATLEPNSIYEGRDREEAVVGGLPQRADLTNVKLENANRTGANLGGVRLARANLRGANFSRAILRHADLFGADLREANFRDANARNATFSGAWLVRADFGRTDLRDANFSASWLLGANLSEARIRGPELQGAHCSLVTRLPSRLSVAPGGARTFRLEKAHVFDRLFGVRYREITDQNEPLVVLRFVGERTRSWNGEFDTRGGLRLPAFAKWIDAWAKMLAALGSDPETGSNMLSLDGFDQMQCGHACVISVVVTPRVAVKLGAILQAMGATTPTADRLPKLGKQARDIVMRSLIGDVFWSQRRRRVGVLRGVHPNYCRVRRTRMRRVSDRVTLVEQESRSDPSQHGEREDLVAHSRTIPVLRC